MILDDGTLIIHDGNYLDFAQKDGEADGKTFGRGYVERDYEKYPVGYAKSTKPLDMPLIPESEIPDRIKFLEDNKATLEDIRDRGAFGEQIPSLDQNGQGYCWMYDAVMCLMILRAKSNLSYKRLSAHAAACKVKSFRDEGGWGPQGVEFLGDKGCPTIDKWAEKSMSRQYDTAETWAEAAKYKIVDQWADLQTPAYDRKLSKQQVVTMILSGYPVAGDFMWWGHSVCILRIINGVAQFGRCRLDSGKLLNDVIQFDKVWGTNTFTGGLSTGIINSWTDSWGKKGIGILTGNQAFPDGAVGPTTVLPYERAA